MSKEDKIISLLKVQNDINKNIKRLINSGSIPKPLTTELNDLISQYNEFLKSLD